MSTSPRRRRLGLFVAVAAALVVAMTSPGARAGTYDVFSCQYPGGHDAGLSGWTGTANDLVGTSVQNACDGAGGAGNMYFGGQVSAGPVPGNQLALWRFEAPPNTTIARYTIFRTAQSTIAPGGAKSYGLYEDEVTLDRQHLADTCAAGSGIPCTHLGDDASPLSSANALIRSGRHAHRLYAFAECTTFGASCGRTSSPGSFRIYEAEIGLEEDVAPAVFGLDGELLRGLDPVAGSGAVGFGATDLGGGVERAELLVDGVSIAAQGMDAMAAGCRRPFVAVVPCPLSVSVELPLDTTGLANGPHRVQAQVVDAAGNVGRSAPVRITTRNGNASGPSVPNGAPPDRAAKLSVSFSGRSVRTVRFGRRARATGRLTTAAGAPIAGATIAVFARVAQPGARWRRVGHVSTGSAGRFGYRPRRGASRTFRFAYRAYSSDPRFAAARILRLRVRAGIRLSIMPRALRNGQTAAFRVRLLGGPGRKGTLVSLQVLRPDRSTFATRGVGRDGVARVLHHFRYTHRPTTYLFRAIVQPQRSYPYLPAASGVVPLRVRP